MASKVAIASAAALYKREHRQTATQLLAETIDRLHDLLKALSTLEIAGKNITAIEPKLARAVTNAVEFIGYEDEGLQEDEPSKVTGL